MSHIEELDKYKKMYWSLHRDTKNDCQFYKNKLLEYERIINIYEKTMYYGQIIYLNHNTHGIIQNDKYNNIFFHKSNCTNFILDTSCVYLDVKFNVSILHGKFQAINIELNENEKVVKCNIIKSNKKIIKSSNKVEIIKSTNDNLFNYLDKI